jgi:hypothetical protein
MDVPVAVPAEDLSAHPIPVAIPVDIDERGTSVKAQQLLQGPPAGGDRTLQYAQSVGLRPFEVQIFNAGSYRKKNSYAAPDECWMIATSNSGMPLCFQRHKFEHRVYRFRLRNANFGLDAPVEVRFSALRELHLQTPLFQSVPFPPRYFTVDMLYAQENCDSRQLELCGYLHSILNMQAADNLTLAPLLNVLGVPLQWHSTLLDISRNRKMSRNR